MTNLLFLTHKTLFGKDLDGQFPPIRNGGLKQVEIIHATYGRIIMKKSHLLALEDEEKINPEISKGLYIKIACHAMPKNSEPAAFTITYNDAGGEPQSENAEQALLDYDFSDNCIRLSIHLLTSDGEHKTINVPYPEGRIRMEPHPSM